MSENPYQVAGWMAIAAAILTIPAFAVSLISDAQRPQSLVLASIAVGLWTIQLACDVYAFYRFRSFLNDRQFHDTDTLIWILIVGSVLISAVGSVGRLMKAAGGSLATVTGTVGLLFIIGFPLGIVAVVFGLRLLRLEDDLRGLLKPYAYATIAAGICFATLILAPIGLLVSAAASVMLGIIFLRTGEAPEALEFV